MRIKLTVSIMTIVLLLPLLNGGCGKGPGLSEDQRQIIDNCINLFTRLKVHDHVVLYENEFPYMHEERDLQEYIDLPGIMAYSADTLLAIQIDSVTVWDTDTAYIHMQLEYLYSDSTTEVTPIRMRWWNVGDTIWIRPSITHILKQREFEEELRVYWEAVKEIERREQERQEHGDN